ncbi:MAG: phage tail protein [Bacteroidota bacterium]
MATDRNTIADAYPIPVYNYRVTVGAQTLAFSEVSGLTREHEKVVYRDGMSFLMGYYILRGQQSEITVTMKRGVVKGDDALYDWVDFTFLERLFSSYKKDILIDLCDETGAPMIRWKLKKAIPLKLEAPSFSADSNEVAVETVELVAQGMDIEYF